MASLAEVFGKQLSRELTDLYWEAFRGAFIEQIVEAARYWIRHGKHFPKPAEILEAIRDSHLKTAKPVAQAEPEVPRWLGRVNGLFFRYLLRRRTTEIFKGDINLTLRREAFLELAGLFERAEADGDEMATVANLEEQFDNAMRRIADASEKPDWLEAELERQRKGDRQKGRQ